MCTAKQDHGTPFSATATHATEAIASLTGAALKTAYVTDISASSDKAGSIILVKSGSTVIWQDIVGASSYRHAFVQPLKADVGAAVSVTIDGTAACKANIAGFVLANA